LKVVIDGEIDVAAGHRLDRPQHSSGQRTPSRVATHHGASGTAAQYAVELQLEPAERHAIETYGAQQLARDVAVRIEPTQHALEVNARYAIQRVAYSQPVAAGKNHPAARVVRVAPRLRFRGA